MNSAKFNSLPDDKKRVAVAKDVIKYLTQNKLRAGTGVYVSPTCDLRATIRNEANIQDTDEIELQPFLIDSLKNESPEIICEVCAKGALFLAEVFYRDDYKFNVSWLNGCQIFEQGTSSKVIKNKLDFFDPDQLDLIELFFEGGNIDKNENIESYKTKATDFVHKTYWDDCNRLLLIMQNIVKNKGTFVPEKLEGYYDNFEE